MFSDNNVKNTFFISYLGRGVVEKLEVVNKKWVRIRLNQGSSAEVSIK